MTNRTDTRAFFFLSASIALAATPAPSAGAPADEHARTGKGHCTARWVRDGLPENVRFSADGRDVSVRVVRVRLIGPEGGAKVKSAMMAGLKEGMTTSSVSWPGGKPARLESAFRNGRPAASFHLAEAGRAEALVIDIAGADRLVRRTDDGFVVASIPGREVIALKGSTVVLQRGADQHGLTVTGPDLRIEPTPGGVSIRVPARPSGGRAARIEVAGFIGDSLLAYERAAETDSARPRAETVAERTDPARAEPAIVQYGGADGAAPTAERPPGDRWLWWAEERTLKPLLADPREAQVRVGWMYDSHSDKFLEAGIGGDLVLAKQWFGPEEELSFSLRGLIVGRLNTCEDNFPLLNTDFFGGVAAAYRKGDDAFELYIFHESSHLGDETLDSGERDRIDFSRESVRLLWSHDFDELRIYAGPTVNVRSSPSDIRGKVTIQAGAEYRWQLWDVPMFAAVDAQTRQEHDWEMNVATQLGVELGDPDSGRNLPRLFVEFFTGHSNMGQYWNERDTYIMLGFGYNFP